LIIGQKVHILQAAAAAAEVILKKMPAFMLVGRIFNESNFDANLFGWRFFVFFSERCSNLQQWTARGMSNLLL
jgi:hypothetical protein